MANYGSDNAGEPSGSKAKQLTEKDIDILKKATNLSEKEIRDSHADFMEDYPSGELDKSGFKKFYEQINGSKTNLNALCDNIFAFFDKDNNGTVNFMEFMVGLAAGNPTDINSRLEFMFELCDVSGDGQMDITELTNFLTASLVAIDDKSQGPKRDPKRAATNIFEVLGVSTDKKITKQQFMDGCRRNPDFQQLFGGSN